MSLINVAALVFYSFAFYQNVSKPSNLYVSNLITFPVQKDNFSRVVIRDSFSLSSDFNGNDFIRFEQFMDAPSSEYSHLEREFKFTFDNVFYGNQTDTIITDGYVGSFVYSLTTTELPNSVYQVSLGYKFIGSNLNIVIVPSSIILDVADLNETSTFSSTNLVSSFDYPSFDNIYCAKGNADYSYNLGGLFTYSYIEVDLAIQSISFSLDFIKLPISTGEEYEEGLIQGYDNGYNDGYSQGFTAGEETGYDTGYGVGYNYGYSLGQSADTNLRDIFFNIADVPIITIRGLFDFELFGMSMYAFVGSLIALFFMLLVVRKVF